MIPKKIHYCWFGKNPFPELAVKCIESWKQYCPDYEIKEWNEENFDLNCCAYVKEAYRARKWAFVTDYVRLYAMVNEGGIYMDTDVEVIKPLDKFLDNVSFSGFETDKTIPTGIMASEKGFPFFSQLLDEYHQKHFMIKNQYDLTTNVTMITNFCKKFGFIANNEKQSICNFTIYPKDYFCPKDYRTGKICLTDNTHAIHHFNGSWLSEKQILRRDKERQLCMKYGVFLGKNIGAIKYAYDEGGLKNVINKIMKKLVDEVTI